MESTKLQSVVQRQLPEFIRADYPKFLAFIKAYYEYMDIVDDRNIAQLRDIDETVDSFIEYFKGELGLNVPDIEYMNMRLFLRKSKHAFVSKGTEDSYKLLFRILFNRPVDISYPWDSVLKASDGKWKQDTSIFIEFDSVITVAASDIVPGIQYTISIIGDTDWNAVAGTSGITYNINTTFTATAAGTGTGVVTTLDERQASAAVKSFIGNQVTVTGTITAKQYVNSLPNGLDSKQYVRAASTTPLLVTYSNATNGVGATLTNAGTQAALVLDGVLLSVGSRVLIKDQAVGLQNGIYVVTTAGSVSTNWVLTRSTDYDNSPGIEIATNVFFYVREGNTQADKGYVVSTNSKINIGSTVIAFSQFSNNKFVKVYVDRIKKVRDRVYELSIDKNYYGDIEISDVVVFGNYTVAICPTTIGYNVLNTGKNYKVGDLIVGTTLANGLSIEQVLRVTKVDSIGGILKVIIVRYGCGYTDDFYLLTTKQAITTPSNIAINRDSVPVYSTPDSGVDQYLDTGSLMEPTLFDFNAASPTAAYANPTYAGETLKTFYNETINNQLDMTDMSLIEFNIGAVAKYQGYYIANDGFLSDAIRLQDSKFYQKFSYVLTVNETIDAYRSYIKSFLHSAGLAMYGEYQITDNYEAGLTGNLILGLE